MHLGEQGVDPYRRRRPGQRLNELPPPAGSVAQSAGKLYRMVASNTTGTPKPRMVMSERMSTTRL